MKSIFGYRSIWYSAMVAATFSIVVCALLLLDGAQRLNKIPLEAPEFVALREQFIERPNDEALRQKIRELDLALRGEYFREQRFTKIRLQLTSWRRCGDATVRKVGGYASTKAPRPQTQGTRSGLRRTIESLWSLGCWEW